MTKTTRSPAFLLVLSFILGFVLGIGLFVFFPSNKNEQKSDTSETKSQVESQEWTCSMHPQIRNKKPGKCPICFMDLIPLSMQNSDNTSPLTIKMSENAVKLAEIETAVVSRGLAEIEIRMPGKVSFDESRLAKISARFPGRIDRLFVNYTGIALKKGDHIAEIFSPDLLVAQREALVSLKQDSNPKMLASVKEKFRRLGFPDSQVDDILNKGKIVDHLTIFAPIAGIVIEKNAVEGKYFETGENLFTIADLNQVWINLEAFETDLPWIRYGQNVEFFVEALPGNKFNGRVAFISPVLDEKSRTVSVRLNAENSDGVLKPGYFVRAILNAKFAGNGKIVEPSLTGKWISPMHPEIVKDFPGKCDVCGMELVSAESLGFIGNLPEKGFLPLLIPASAPLITGKRAVVYVDKGNSEYEYREIVLGPKAGNFYVLQSGLEEGEKVVVNGNFKIDSAMQLLTKSSMITSLKEKNNTDKETQNNSYMIEHKTDISEQLLDAYFAVQKALAADDLKSAKENAKLVDQHFLSSLADSININSAREKFAQISAKLNDELSNKKTKLARKIYRFYCPMAFENRGAYWLQDTEQIANPYFGAVMLRCGTELEE